MIQTHKRLIDSIEYFFIFIVILQANTVYANISKYDKIIFLLFHAMLVIILFISLFGIYSLNSKRNLLNRIYIFIVPFALFIFIYLMVEKNMYGITINDFVFMILFPSILLFYFYYLYECNCINSLFFKFEDFILILSIISLLFWILALLGVNPNMTTLSKFAVIDNTPARIVPGYFNIDFIAQGTTKFLGFNVIRNTGIFSEAPIYSSVLLIALFIELFLRKSNNILNYRSILLIITILSTTSTNGVILMIPACICAAMINGKQKSFISRFGIILLFLIALIVIKSTILTKVGDNTLNSSSSLRRNDFIVAFNAWKDHPFIGNGLHKYLSIIKYMPSWRMINGTDNIALSTGFMSILAYGGMLLEIFYILPIILSMKISKNIFCFSLFMFLLLIIEDVSGFYIYDMVISYLWILIILGGTNNNKLYNMMNIS